MLPLLGPAPAPWICSGSRRIEPTRIRGSSDEYGSWTRWQILADLAQPRGRQGAEVLPLEDHPA